MAARQEGPVFEDGPRTAPPLSDSPGSVALCRLGPRLQG